MIKFAVAKLNPFVIGYNLLIFIQFNKMKEK